MTVLSMPVLQLYFESLQKIWINVKESRNMSQDGKLNDDVTVKMLLLEENLCEF